MTKWGTYDMRPAQPEIHVVPMDRDNPDKTHHILLALVCFCNPYRDAVDPEIVIHREPS